MRSIRITVSLIAGALFVACLLSPAVLEGQTLANAHWNRGWTYFLMGWIGIFELQFGWCANILLLPLIISVVLGMRTNIWFAAIATALVCSVLFWKTTLYDVEAHNFALGPGYWMWLGCSLVLLSLAICERVFHLPFDAESA